LPKAFGMKTLQPDDAVVRDAVDGNDVDRTFMKICKSNVSFTSFISFAVNYYIG